MNSFPEVNLPGALKISSLKFESFARSEKFWKNHKPEFLAHPLPYSPHQARGSRKVADERKLA